MWRNRIAPMLVALSALPVAACLPLRERPAAGKPVATLDLPAVAPAQPVVAPAPPPAGAHPAIDDKAAVTALVDRWVRAWSASDADIYLACYAPDFRPGEKLSRGQWEQSRRERLKTPRNIAVRVEQLNWQQTSPVRGHATFLQHYRAHSYSDDRRKVLELEKVDGRWLIVRETIR